MQKVVPAILTADPGELKTQLGILKNHAKWVHIDIMDGAFVPAVSVNLSELGEAYQFFNLEIHLMVKDPEKYLEDCSAAGAKRVYFHVEAASIPAQVVSAMGQYSFQKGVALNPETPVEQLTPFVQQAQAVLVMSVVPGAQGQSFIPSVLSKVQPVRRLASNIVVGVDGGVSEANIAQAFEKGADYVAAGSSVWKAPDPIAALSKLEEMAEETKKSHGA